MSTLSVPAENIKLNAHKDIKEFLNQRGVRYERWDTSEKIDRAQEPGQILKSYEKYLGPFMAAGGYQSADVINVTQETENIENLKNMFLGEHTHTEDEIRLFVAGEGLFWFNQEQGPVFCLHCTEGDLISVPANTKHWFDLGPNPNVCAIRIFTDKSGWTPHYTDSGVDTDYNGKYQNYI